MGTPATYHRLNIYLDDSTLRQRIKIAAARQEVTISAYCLEAIRHRLVEDGFLSSAQAGEGPQVAAQALDQLRRQIGPIGTPVRDLIAEGRRR